MQAWHQLIRFLGVGVLNTLVGYGLLFSFLYSGLVYPQALLCAHALGVLFNYKTTGRLVFQDRSNRAIGRFILVYSGLYVVNLVLIRAFLSVTNSAYWAGLPAVVITACLGFLLNKQLVFKEKNEAY